MNRVFERWRNSLTTIVVFFVLIVFVHAQSTQRDFDVATIKPSGDSSYSNMNFNTDGFSTQNMTLQSVLKFAYDLTSESQIIGAPDWMRSAKFDIQAKEDDETIKDLGHMPFEDRIKILRPMIQRLLANRFGLKVHQEKREMSVLALMPAKSGAKIQLSTAMTDQNPADSLPARGWLGLHDNGHGEMEGRDATVDMLVAHLTSEPEIGGRLVVNRTGLTGKYDFKMQWTPERRAEVDPTGPSLFTALEEQLGLKLNLMKSPVDVVIVDHVTSPSAN